MGHKKKLNVNGDQITYRLNVKDFNESNIKFQRLYLDITVDEQEIYSYQICEDTRFTIEYLKNKIPEELDFAMKNFNKVEISEYTDRNYLFFEVHHKDFHQMQVTGIRL